MKPEIFPPEEKLSPSDLKTFSIKELETLSDELREFLLYSVGKSGGHLGGGLGVIELTIIIHHLFDTPYDLSLIHI